MYLTARAVILRIALLIPVLAAAVGNVVPVLANQPAWKSTTVADMDLSVDPAADFYRYANGGWLDHAVIPADFPAWDTMTALDGQTRLQLVELLQANASDPSLVKESDTWKAVQLFQQGTDLDARNAAGLRPIQGTIDEINAITDVDQLHQFLQTSLLQSVPGFFFPNAGPDVKGGREAVAYFAGPSLGLPGRDYYLAENAADQPVQTAYIQTTAKLLLRSGMEVEDADAAALQVFAFEAKLAKATWSAEEASEFDKTLIDSSISDLTSLYPAMDWAGYFEAIGLNTNHVVVTEERYLASLSDIVEAAPLRVVKDFLAMQLLWSASSSLDAETERIAFEYFGGALNGLQAQAPIEGRILDQVNVLFGDALGQMYVAKYFSPGARQQGEQLTQVVIEAFRQRLERNAWMTPETRKAALIKLDSLKVKIGYPDTWESYQDVTIGDSYFASAMSAFGANYRRSLAKVGKPIDREAWPFPPQTVNAMYNPANNEIVVPAAVLQAPLFDADGDVATNMGAIGFVIGHEITHGFDSRGSQFDGDGVLRNWWTEQDAENFSRLNDEVVAQYEELKVAGRGLNGERTLAENVADLGGIQVAYDALQEELTTEDTASQDVHSDFTADQRFFIAAATVWRSAIRDESLATQLATDTHAPSVIRAVQPLRNCDAFYHAFDIDPGDPMYLPPSERIVIW